jgi:60 kDa SS-A/Ro ribonucleoprotein
VANKSLFQTIAGKWFPKPDAVNSEGAPAYAFSSKHALAQYAATGCLNTTFYATAEMQLETVLRLCDEVPAEFVAKTALYARERGFMKDLPALLCALLTVKDPVLCDRIFDRVIDDGKMLRNFVQIVRSGVVGRKSLGSMPKRLVRRWFEKRDDAAVFRASVGQTPSLADVIKMAHPRPASKAREALYGYLIGRAHDVQALPELVRQFETYKFNQAAPRGTPSPSAQGRSQLAVPDVPFQMLTALELGPAEWVAIARQASWQQTRMNLNAFARHGVFDKKGMTDLIADRLRDATAIQRARVLPYQLMMAYLAVDKAIPRKVQNALQDAMEVALKNVPALSGKIYVCPDVSGSMASPVTGFRRGSTTAVRCIDVAALVAAAFLRKNDAEVLPFEHEVVSLRLNARDSVMTNAQKLASIGGGGTSCSAPLAELNRQRARGDLVVFVSDNESWVDAGGRGTEMMRQWAAFKARNPQAKLACIDLQPNRTTQAREGGDILNVGGFSDAVFELLAAFSSSGLDARHWVDTIDRVAA